MYVLRSSSMVTLQLESTFEAMLFPGVNQCNAIITDGQTLENMIQVVMNWNYVLSASVCVLVRWQSQVLC